MKLLLLFVALISTNIANGTDSTFFSEKQTVYKKVRADIIQKSFPITSIFWFEGDQLYAYTISGGDTCGGPSRVKEVSRRTRRKAVTVLYHNLDQGKVTEVRVVWNNIGRISAIYFHNPTDNTTVGYF